MKTIGSLFSALALIALGLSNGAWAETWTGCVTPGGTIIHMSQGDAPLKYCGKNQTVIHLTDKASKQNTQATYDHEAICIALDTAGADAAALTALGCPTGGEMMPNGAPILVLPNALGPLAVADCIYANGSCWRIEDAFVGQQNQVPNSGLPENFSPTSACALACEGDDRCFLSWLENAGSPDKYPSLACHLFYRSTTLGATEHVCGDSEQACLNNNLNSQSAFWYRAEN